LRGDGFGDFRVDEFFDSAAAVGQRKFAAPAVTEGGAGGPAEGFGALPPGAAKGRAGAASALCSAVADPARNWDNAGGADGAGAAAC